MLEGQGELRPVVVGFEPDRPFQPDNGQFGLASELTREDTSGSRPGPISRESGLAGRAGALASRDDHQSRRDCQGLFDRRIEGRLVAVSQGNRAHVRPVSPLPRGSDDPEEQEIVDLAKESFTSRDGRAHSLPDDRPRVAIPGPRRASRRAADRARLRLSPTKPRRANRRASARPKKASARSRASKLASATSRRFADSRRRACKSGRSLTIAAALENWATAAADIRRGSPSGCQSR